MAIPAITPEDFKGFYKLALNSFKEEDLEAYVTQFTQVYLRQIVGSAAYSKMTTEDAQKWLDLWNGLDFQDINDDGAYLTSFKKVILGFIYFEFVRDNFTTTTVGKVKGKSENSERATDLEVANLARSRYNYLIPDLNESFCKFLEVYEELSSEIEDSYDLGNDSYVLSLVDDTYLNTGLLITIGLAGYTVTQLETFTIDAGVTGLDFAGLTASWDFSEVVESSEDNNDNTYNVLVASTEALSTGDTVNVDGTDYTATNVIKDTCFTIDAGVTGLDFAGLTATWSFVTVVSVSIDLNDNNYILAVEDPTYLELGGTVDVDGTDYTVDEVSNRYQIDAGGTGLDFSGLVAVWHPFESVVFKELKISGI